MGSGGENERGRRWEFVCFCSAVAEIGVSMVSATTRVSRALATARLPLAGVSHLPAQARVRTLRLRDSERSVRSGVNIGGAV